MNCLSTHLMVIAHAEAAQLSGGRAGGCDASFSSAGKLLVQSVSTHYEQQDNRCLPPSCALLSSRQVALPAADGQLLARNYAMDL